MLFALGLFSLPCAAAEASEIVSFALPLRCEPGVTCFVQNYVDHDASPESRDYHCGARTYDGHDGTDIRVPDLEAQRRGVEVLAAASGRIVGARDGMEDISIRSIGKAAVAGKECGNGIMVEHENGWRTQYCHMAKGSLRVKPGDRVEAGQPIGLVGLSGNTEFPHLHFTVRHRNDVVDPFAYDAPPGSCSGGQSLWAEPVREQMKYRDREILNLGFADIAPTMELIESGEVLKHAPSSQSDALAAYVRAIGLKKGDQQILTVRNPDGAVVSEYLAPALESDKAQYFVASGRKRKEAAWPEGTYAAIYRVRRDDKEMLRKAFEFRLGAK